MLTIAKTMPGQNDCSTGNRLSAIVIQACGILALLVAASGYIASAHASDDKKVVFQRVQMQYIAAIADPDANSGTGAESWGVWRTDPGLQGVWLSNFEKQLAANDGNLTANWQFDSEDWWLDENGLIMDKPDFPLPPGKYIVTGAREIVSMLTIHPADENGEVRWELAEDTTLYDVTHLECRSARYTPKSGQGNCSPGKADTSIFPVTPGAVMPAVESCQQQEYAVLLLIGIGVEI